MRSIKKQDFSMNPSFLQQSCNKGRGPVLLFPDVCWVSETNTPSPSNHEPSLLFREAKPGAFQTLLLEKCPGFSVPLLYLAQSNDFGWMEMATQKSRMAAKVPFGESFLRVVFRAVVSFLPQLHCIFHGCPVIFIAFIPGEKYENLIKHFRNQERN